jgi:uncharacterized protein
VQNVQRTVLWRCLFQPGMEYFNLWQEGEHWRLEGSVVLALDGYPTEVLYHVFCNAQWQTVRVDIDMNIGATTRELRILVDEKHHWHVDGKELRAVRGCLDVDLSVTPATNTLPIRRLNLPVGEKAEVTAAWVRFPELTLQTLTQNYQRIEENRYWYQSELGNKIWDLTVDEMGIVRRYAELWESEAAI